MQITSWLQRFEKRLRKPAVRKSARKRNAASAETMESRVLLTVTTNFTPGTGQLDVSSDAADAITIGIDGGSGNVTVNAS